MPYNDEDIYYINGAFGLKGLHTIPVPDGAEIHLIEDDYFREQNEEGNTDETLEGFVLSVQTEQVEQEQDADDAPTPEHNENDEDCENSESSESGEK